QHFASRRLDEAADKTQQRRLAASARTDDRHEFTGLDDERRRQQCLDNALLRFIRVLDVLNADPRALCLSRRLRRRRQDAGAPGRFLQYRHRPSHSLPVFHAPRASTKAQATANAQAAAADRRTATNDSSAHARSVTTVDLSIPSVPEIEFQPRNAARPDGTHEEYRPRSGRARRWRCADRLHQTAARSVASARSRAFRRPSLAASARGDRLQALSSWPASTAAAWHVSPPCCGPRVAY